MNADRAKYNWRQDNPTYQMVAVSNKFYGLLDNFRNECFGHYTREEYMEKIEATVKELSELTQLFLINPDKWVD